MTTDEFFPKTERVRLGVEEIILWRGVGHYTLDQLDDFATDLSKRFEDTLITVRLCDEADTRLRWKNGKQQR